MDMELKVFFFISIYFVLLSIVVAILVRRVTELKSQLNEISDMYRRTNTSYEIVLARTNELNDGLKKIRELSLDCCRDVGDYYSVLGTLVSTIHDCQDTVDDIHDCMNSINDTVVPVIRSDHDILKELKEKILTETEKETSNDN